MLLIGSTSDGTQFAIIRHLPIPNRKNSNKPSGPIMRLTRAEMGLEVLSIIVNHFKGFDAGSEPVQSELDSVTDEARTNFFGQHRFVCVEKKQGGLLVIPSTAVNNSPFQIEFSPPDQGVYLKPPWSADQILKNIDTVMSQSRNLLAE